MAYIAVAIYAYWPASLLSHTSLAGGGQGDPAGQVVDVAWIAFTLSHHVNPFFTDFVNYPQGVNLASNAVAPVIGLLLSPITIVLGPIAAYNLALCLAFVSAACAMFFVLLRVVKSVFAAFLAGLMYGFSPYMVGEGEGHLAILYTAMAPLALYLLYRLMRGQTTHPYREAIILGLVLAIQVYLSVEILADLVTVAVFLVLVVALRHPRLLLTRPRQLVGPLSAGLVALAAIGGYLIWMLLFGPQHLTGPPQPSNIENMFHADLLGPLVPTPVMRFAPTWLSSIGTRWSVGNYAEYGIYLGAPIVAAVAGTVIWLRKTTIVRLSALGALIALVLAMGTRLTIAGHMFTSVPMPLGALDHLPLFSGEIPSCYSLFEQLFAAVILAFGLDRLLAVVKARSIRSGAVAGARVGTSAAVMALSLGLLVPLVPVFPYAQGAAGIPKFFSTRAVRNIPFGSVLLAYPYPSPPIYNQAQLWQAEAGFRFKLLGGYAIFRTPNGSGSPIPPVLNPSVVQDIFSIALVGSGATGTASSISPDKSTLDDIRTFLHTYRVATIAIDPIGDQPELAIDYVSDVLGHPSVEGGMNVWFDVPSLLSKSRSDSGASKS